MDVFSLYGAQSNVYEHFLRILPEELQAGMADPCLVGKAEDYFNRRLNGAIDQIDVNNAYGNKQTYGKSQLLEMFGNDPCKKAVFVLAHAFSPPQCRRKTDVQRLLRLAEADPWCGRS